MRKGILIFTLISFLLLNTPVLAQEPLNNIDLQPFLKLTMNVTLVNTGEYPKFIAVNPTYDFKTFREGDENLLHNTTDLIQLSKANLILNKRVGFWIYPHEVLKVEFSINIPMDLGELYLQDYADLCYPDYTITWSTKRITYPPSLGVGPLCEVVYPHLINYPILVDLTSFIQVRDPEIVIYSYSGEVEFTITNRGPKTMFAVALPLIPVDAKIYSITPNPDMNYTEYMGKFLPTYLKSQVQNAKFNLTQESVLFEYTDTLLSTMSSQQNLIQNSITTNEDIVDYPIWIVVLGENSSFDIKYKFQWEFTR